MSRVLPTGRSPSNTASSRKVLLDHMGHQVLDDGVHVHENRIRLRSGSWWNSDGMSILLDAKTPPPAAPAGTAGIPAVL
jgi:hypothetical protein